MEVNNTVDSSILSFASHLPIDKAKAIMGISRAFSRKGVTNSINSLQNTFGEVAERHEVNEQCRVLNG